MKLIYEEDKIKDEKIDKMFGKADVNTYSIYLELSSSMYVIKDANTENILKLFLVAIMGICICSISEIIDTYPEFFDFYEKNIKQSLDSKFESSEYSRKIMK